MQCSKRRQKMTTKEKMTTFGLISGKKINLHSHKSYVQKYTGFSFKENCPDKWTKSVCVRVYDVWERERGGESIKSSRISKGKKIASINHVTCSIFTMDFRCDEIMLKFTENSSKIKMAARKKLSSFNHAY